MGWRRWAFLSALNTFTGVLAVLVIIAANKINKSNPCWELDDDCLCSCQIIWVLIGFGWLIWVGIAFIWICFSAWRKRGAEPPFAGAADGMPVAEKL